MRISGAIFDLDGVIVDTAKYHYLAWSRLAQELGFRFSIEDNERLKGVSRMRSLEILLETGGLSHQFSKEQMNEMAARKNTWYKGYLAKMGKDELLPGATKCLEEFRRRGIKTALGSASKNARLVLRTLNLQPFFDAVIDGNTASLAKPDPEIFLLAAQAIGASPSECIVFEDAQAGIDAARAGGMFAVAIGSPENLQGYDLIFSSLAEVIPEELIRKLGRNRPQIRQ